jgi:hypothetical protein
MKFSHELKGPQMFTATSARFQVTLKGKKNVQLENYHWRVACWRNSSIRSCIDFRLEGYDDIEQ